MNPGLNKLQPYPFERVRHLLNGIQANPALSSIALSVGEPRHPAPAFVLEELARRLPGLSSYPSTQGIPELRMAIAHWVRRRFRLPVGTLHPETQVLPVNGTREALFSVTQALVTPGSDSLVLMPNPGCQIYEGAAFLAGAQPYYLNCHEENGFLPDLAAVPEAIWSRCQLLYLCSPGNPTGAVMDLTYLQQVIALADRHNFIIAADECYSEIYPDENNPPPGLLEACIQNGRDDFRRCLVFHSLSKRSNLPGLRSGFVAGDAHLIAQFLRYRTYHGCAMSLPNQYASIAAWNDEAHVLANRDLYRASFTTVLPILQTVLDVKAPAGSFYLWPRLPVDDEEFTVRLFRDGNVHVVPGSYLSRHAQQKNPGHGRARLSLVAQPDVCRQAAERIQAILSGRNPAHT